MPLFFFMKNITNLGTKNFRKNPLYLWGVKESYTFKNHCVAKNGKRTSTTYKTYPDIKRKPCKMLFGCEMGSTIGLWLFCILYVGVEKWQNNGEKEGFRNSSVIIIRSSIHNLKNIYYHFHCELYSELLKRYQVRNIYHDLIKFMCARLLMKCVDLFFYLWWPTGQKSFYIKSK